MNASAYSPFRGWRMMTHSWKARAASLSGLSAALTCEGDGKVAVTVALIGSPFYSYSIAVQNTGACMEQMEVCIMYSVVNAPALTRCTRA